MAGLSPSASNRPLLRRAWLLPAAGLVLVFHFSPFGAALDRAWFDAVSRRPWRAPPLPPDSALVLVDRQTMDVLGREPYAMRWPFPRAAFAALIAALDRAGAERIVVDFTFLDQSESAEQDLLLAATAAAARQTVLGRTAQQGPVFWDDNFLRAHPGFFAQSRAGNTEFLPDRDGVARAYPARGSLAAAALASPPDDPGGLLRWHGGLKQIEARGVPLIPAAHFILAGLPIVDRLSRAAPDFSPEGFARALASEPRLSGGASDLVRGRTVFVGTNVSGTFDVKPMPVGELEPGVLLHWTAWTNLVAGGFITAAPRGVSLALAALAAAGLLALADRRPGITWPAWSAIGFGVLLLPVAYAGLSAGWFFAPATPIMAAGLTLLGVVAENFWAEQRRKREIQALFGAYVDPAVVDRLVRDPAAIRLGGEKREATVYFSDLAGFTDLSEQLPPEQLMEIVNLYLQEMSECLLDHGAYIDKYIGDAVMAVFGAPQPRSDHAAAACAGALAAQQVLDRINARLVPLHGHRLAMRIGINTGEMLVGNLGSARKKNYTVLGDAVNLASRLEGANKEFGTRILLGETTARAVAGRFATRPLTRLRVKGKQTAVEVHELVGEPDRLTPAQRDFLAAYHEGYAHFTARRFGEAEAAFARARPAAPEDAVTIALHSQARMFKVNPPGADWEPVLTLETK